MERAAGGLKQTGPRILGFQKFADDSPLNGPIHPRSTTHTKPFLPSTAVSYPCGPRTRTFASWDIESGAALRARAISAFRSGIRYSLSVAMLEYGVLDCACVCELAPSATASTKLANPINLDVLWTIWFPFQLGSWSDPPSMMLPSHLRNSIHT